VTAEGDDAARYMLGGLPPDQLAEMIDVVEVHSEVELVEVKGAPEAPSLLIIETTERGAEELRGQLPPEAVLEPDSPLQM
jgi:hypothetical protein